MRPCTAPNEDAEGVVSFSGHAHLISLCVLADKSLVIGCECGSVVVDVQHSDVDRHPADLLRVVWKRSKDVLTWKRKLAAFTFACNVLDNQTHRTSGVPWTY